MRMFAGPNGAGKTSLMREIVTNNYADLGVILNADQIYRALTQKPFLDLSEYKQGDVTQNELESFANEFSDIEERLHKPFEHFTLRINEGFLVKK